MLLQYLLPIDNSLLLTGLVRVDAVWLVSELGFTWAVHHLRLLNIRVHMSRRLRGHVIQTQVICIALLIATLHISLLEVAMLW